MLQPNDPDRYYASRELVPNDMLRDLEWARIVVTNYHAFLRCERREPPPRSSGPPPTDFRYHYRKGGRVASRQTLAVRGYRDRLKRGGWVRCEVKVRRDDVELIRSVATALRDPDRDAATRALLRDRLGDPRPRGFKELLASCPVDLDLDRSRDLGRDIEI